MPASQLKASTTGRALLPLSPSQASSPNRNTAHTATPPAAALPAANHHPCLRPATQTPYVPPIQHIQPYELVVDQPLSATPNAVDRWHVQPDMTVIYERRTGKFEEARVLTASTLRDTSLWVKVPPALT